MMYNMMWLHRSPEWGLVKSGDFIAVGCTLNVLFQTLIYCMWKTEIKITLTTGLTACKELCNSELKKKRRNLHRQDSWKENSTGVHLNDLHKVFFLQLHFLLKTSLSSYGVVNK